MYHVVTGIAPEDPQVGPKVEAISQLPGATEAVTVTIVHVCDDDSELLSVPAVKQAHDELLDRGLSVKLQRSTATPLNAVVSVADDVDADCICIGGRRRSPAGKTQLRNGSEAVILNTDRPVLIAGHAADNR